MFLCWTDVKLTHSLRDESARITPSDVSLELLVVKVCVCDGQESLLADGSVVCVVVVRQRLFSWPRKRPRRSWRRKKLFKQALKVGESCYRRSQQLQHHGAQYEAQHSECTHTSLIHTHSSLIYTYTYTSLTRTHTHTHTHH